MIECNNCEVEITGCDVKLRYPNAYLPLIENFNGGLKKKRISQVYVKLGLPRKPRTTGKRSQNTHIHGHATEIAQDVGESKSKIIADAVDMAMGELGRDFPTHVDYKGDVVADSEPDWDTRTAAVVIEKLHMISTMIPMSLTEYDDSKEN